MTINRISILRTSALVAFITTACAHLAPSQQVGSPFPSDPRVRSVSTDCSDCAPSPRQR